MPMTSPHAQAVEMYHRALALRDEGDRSQAIRLLSQCAALFGSADRRDDRARALAVMAELFDVTGTAGDGEASMRAARSAGPSPAFET